MRSIWKGSLVFGLVNVPVAVYAATEDHDIRFHQVHDADGGRIRYQRTCEVCGKVIQFGNIVKSFEADDGRTAVITDDDLKSLPANSEREIDLLSFVPADQIDPVLYDQAYLLEPSSKSPKAYILLRETLADTDRVAIVHFALRQKTRLAALRVRGDTLVIQTLRWPDEVRQGDFESLNKPVEVSAAEKQMAALLVDSYADDFRPEEHEDRYRAELEQLIEAKLEGGHAFPEAPATQGEDAEVLDLLAALQRSVQRHKEADSGGSGKADADAAPEEEPVAPRRRAAARSKARAAAADEVAGEPGAADSAPAPARKSRARAKATGT